MKRQNNIFYESAVIGNMYGTFKLVEQRGSTSGIGVLWRLVCNCGSARVLYTYEFTDKDNSFICPNCKAKG